MTSMVAIIITGKMSPGNSDLQNHSDRFRADMAPLSQVAVLRSYVNIAAIIGRGVGGPIGGVLFDHIGWRWYVAFLLKQQSHPALICQ